MPQLLGCSLSWEESFICNRTRRNDLKFHWGGLGEELGKSSQKGLFWKALEEAAQGMVESPFLEGFETWRCGPGDMAQW